MKITSEEQEKLVTENINLVYHLMKKLFIENSEYEDIASIGKIGLIKAAITFDETKKIKFTTYASRCILNEIRMYFRREKSNKNMISLDSVIVEDDSNRITLGNILPDKKSNFVEDIIEDEKFENIMSIILNCLNNQELICLLYEIAGYTQIEIGAILGISQSYISRIQKTTKKKVKQKTTLYFEKGYRYQKKYILQKVYNMYKVSFRTSDIERCRQLLLENSKFITLSQESNKFQIVINKDEINIWINVSLESFAIIAEIIKSIKELNLKLIPYN